MAEITNRFSKWEPNCSGMASFPDRLLTPLGKTVFAQARLMVGRAPKYKGCSKAGVYLKWMVEDTEDGTVRPKWDTRYGGRRDATYRAPLTNEDDIKVFRDWLLDEGIEVIWSEMNVQEYTERQLHDMFESVYADERKGMTYNKAKERWKKVNPPAGRLRRYIKIDLR